jgi:hypothetical protein
MLNIEFGTTGLEEEKNNQQEKRKKFIQIS